MGLRKALSLLINFFALCWVMNGATYADAPRLEIGIIAPLSGPLAEYGQAFKNGIELAKREEPSIAASCDFAFEDSKYDPKLAVSSLQKLAADGYKIIYNWGGPTSAAVAPLAERLKLAMFVLSMDPRVSKNSSRVVRFANSGTQYGAELAKAVKRTGLRRVGIVRAENDYLNDILGGLRAAAAPDLVVDEIASYLPSDTDFRSAITKIRSVKPDGVGVFLMSGQVSNFYRQLNEQHINEPTFGTDFFESTSEIKAAGPLIENAFFPNNAVEPQFQSGYLKRFGNDFQITYAANGYDFATLMCRDLASKRPELSADDILELVKTVKSAGKLGPYKYVNEDGDKYMAFPVVIRRVTGGAIVTDAQDKHRRDGSSPHEQP